MMGTKERHFAPLINVSLEQRVPPDHFYRHLEKTLDLFFIPDLVRDCYAFGGRPSVDPVVFFKLQLVLFFEGLRSERQLMRMVADRLSVHWYLGYDLGEPLPDHSSLTRIRDRYGLTIFRRLFESVVEQCRQAKLLWGKELHVDATQVDANASLDSVQPRFFVEAHLETLFGRQSSDVQEATEGTQPGPTADAYPSATSSETNGEGARGRGGAGESRSRPGGAPSSGAYSGCPCCGDAQHAGHKQRPASRLGRAGRSSGSYSHPWVVPTADGLGG